MSVTISMLDLLCSAQKAHCRIKRWKLDHAEAMKLAYEIPTHKNPSETYDAMVSGNATIFGSRIVVQ